MEKNGIFSTTHGGSGMLALEISLHHQQTPTVDGGVGGAGDGKLGKGSPWQRMKWTDNMVRLLIMVVFYVEDEVVSDQIQVQPLGSDAAAAKKSGGGGGGGGGGGVLQKKGKWKSVSRGMMERGFYVSPQQCEDKFNDLNKRYKRVIDILGRGTACKVVENQSFLESMDHLPAKLKEEAKKLLNSKHLFFREMCAYHNTTPTAIATDGGGSGGGGVVHGGGCCGGGVVVAHHSSPPNEQPPHKRQKCVHSIEDDGEEDDDGDGYNYGYRDEEEDDGLRDRNRYRTVAEENEGEGDGNESAMRRFDGELSCVIGDLTKSVWEKKEWMRVKMVQLKEERLGFEGEGYELEKRRLQWVKFCWSREREMEEENMRNERMKIENERMVILLRQKEMELVDLQQ
ncbi:hypothetical protein SSX86_023665 [Deinandra increscens subsp. villosa]|uniref:Myb/SANT-like DNA-binding domain-containing protein n=1 Tax=Deinandra increscens subsp. villosa TaxID=3103831 RepID=A0AAP0CRG6_9ASTR